MYVIICLIDILFELILHHPCFVEAKAAAEAKRDAQLEAKKAAEEKRRIAAEGEYCITLDL